MPYGKSEDIKKLKKQVQEQMPGVNIDNLSQNDMQKMVLNEINKNSSIDPSIKEKINKGDIDGLKEDLINYLGRSKGGDSEKLVKMLKNNDMDGLKNQLMGMLLGGLNSQKKNEITEGSSENNSFAPTSLLPAIFNNNPLLGSIMGNAFEGNKSDDRVVFLKSMKPFVSEKRQKSIDDCIRMLGVVSFFDKSKGKVES